jgi:hypothetical protein
MKNQVGELCNTYGGGERRVPKIVGGKCEGKYHLGVVSVCDMLILK